MFKYNNKTLDWQEYTFSFNKEPFCKQLARKRLSVKEEIGNGNWNIILVGKVFLLFPDLFFISYINGLRWKLSWVCQGSFHLKSHSYSFIQLFIDWATQYIKSGNFLILYTFFAGNLFRSCILLFKSFPVPRNLIPT